MDLLSHDTFRGTDTYAELCRDYDLDPARPLEDQAMNAAEALAFWESYHQLRAAATPRDPEDVAADTEALIRAAQARPGAMAVITRYGPVLAVRTVDGRPFTLTADWADERAVGAAMIATLARADHAAAGGARDPDLS